MTLAEYVYKHRNDNLKFEKHTKSFAEYCKRMSEFFDGRNEHGSIGYLLFSIPDPENAHQFRIQYYGRTFEGRFKVFQNKESEVFGHITLHERDEFAKDRYVLRAECSIASNRIISGIPDIASFSPLEIGYTEQADFYIIMALANMAVTAPQ